MAILRDGGGVLVSANVADLFGDYNQTIELLCVILASSMISYVNAKDQGKKIFWMFISGFITGCCFLHKQSLMAAAGITLIVFMILYCYYSKTPFIKNFIIALSGILVPVIGCIIWLLANKALIPFLEQVYLNADSKGGGIFDIVFLPFFELFKQYNLLAITATGILVFYNIRKKNNFGIVLSIISFAAAVLIEQHDNMEQSFLLFLKCGFLLILIVIGNILILFENRYKKNNKVFAYIIFVTASFILLEVFMLISIGDFSYKWYIETNTFSEIQNFLSNIMFLLLMILIGYLSVSCLKLKEKPIELLILSDCAFICGYAGLMTAKTTITTYALALIAPIVLAVTFMVKTPMYSIKNASVIVLSLVFCAACMSQKITCAYSWWGTSESEIYEETYGIQVDGLQGFRVSEEQALMFQEVVKTITDNSDSDSTLMGFPGVTIFNLLTERDFAGFVPVYFYDVCADQYALKDAKLYYTDPPDIVVWCDIPGCIETHEEIFRDGNPCGQRDIINWFASVQDDYTMICQVSNVYVYKRNNDIPIGYTFFENAGQQPSTIYVTDQKSYFDYVLSGSGTLDSPYLIQSADDLYTFQEMVNNGLDFSDKYVKQTCDIQLSSEEEWTPIGIADSGNYFCGTYDGGGYVISDLTITKESRRENETMYSGLFGMLGGTVKNLGLEDVNIYGDYIGGIASHPYQNPSIINCYVKGTLVAESRAGGIADNFSGGDIENCYFEGSVSAPTAFGIVSYQANSVMYTVSVGIADFNHTKATRTRDNVVVESAEGSIADTMNKNISKTLALQENSQKEAFNKWNYSEEGVCLTGRQKSGRIFYYIVLASAIAIAVVAVVLHRKKRQMKYDTHFVSNLIN